MRKRRNGACLALMIICMMMAAGCTRSEKKESDLPAVNEEQDKEKDPDVVTFDNGQDGTDGEVPLFILKKEDADSLIEEELSGSGCSAEYKESLEIDESGYYTYTVKDPDGKVMDQMLAVDGFSGDVKVYDHGMKKISDFSEFTYYDRTARKYKDISWDGEFEKDGVIIELLPGDDSSFEFAVYRDNKVILTGPAVIDRDEAVFKSEDKKEEVVFSMTDPGKLKVAETGELKISGEYKRK
ncbi:MAG: hypothetical protein IK139_04085 [Lachnospiraceae bacterium]|nr:hypothetical protein [Lachnospiraceae bacterium]